MLCSRTPRWLKALAHCSAECRPAREPAPLPVRPREILEGLVAHPMLHGPYIEPPAQHARGIGRTKCLQIKLCRVEFGALRDRFAVIQHVLFAVSGRGWEH